MGNDRYRSDGTMERDNVWI